jgi:hypothetical protein
MKTNTIVITAPQKETPKELAVKQPRLFLAGTIDMGISIDWQKKAAKALEDLPVTLFNPRRTHWNRNWIQSARSVHSKLKEQILWELKHMEKADIVAVWLAPKSQSPITLLEIGLHARSGKMIIGCPYTFWRAANIYVTAARYRVPVVCNWREFIDTLRKRIGEFSSNISNKK